MNLRNGQERNLLQRQHVMQIAIVQSLSVLRDSTILNIDQTVRTVNQLCKAAIIDNQVLKRLEVMLTGGTTNKVGYFSAEIDWERHAIHIRNGDEYIHLDTGGGAIELRHIADTLHHLAAVMRGSCHYAKWTRSKIVVNWRWGNQTTDTQIFQIREALNFGPLTHKDSEKVMETRAVVLANNTPDKIYTVDAKATPDILDETIFGFCVVAI